MFAEIIDQVNLINDVFYITKQPFSLDMSNVVNLKNHSGKDFLVPCHAYPLLIVHFCKDIF